MYKQSLAALFVMATLAGCASTKVQNPVNYITFRNEPLVRMSRRHEPAGSPAHRRHAFRPRSA